jgi:hypothetical protein
MARKGVSSKFNAPRAGMLCIGCIRTSCGSAASEEESESAPGIELTKVIRGFKNSADKVIFSLRRSS